MTRLTTEQAQKLTTQYGGRYVSIKTSKQYKGVSWGYVVVVTEDGLIYWDEEFRRNFTVSWEDFDGFGHVSEPKSMSHPRYNKSTITGKFVKKQKRVLTSNPDCETID